MSMVFMLIIAPFALLIVHFTTKLLFDNKEAIIMMQDKIMERKDEANLDDIMEEVRLYDVAAKPVKEAPKVKKHTQVTAKKTTGEEVALRNDLLKGTAIIGLVGLSAWLGLMSPILYVPAIVLTLCGMSYKYGEWKGQTK